MKKIIIGLILAVAAVIPLHVSLVSASGFGTGSPNQDGFFGGVAADSQPFGTYSGAQDATDFYGSGNTNLQAGTFGVCGSDCNQDSFFDAANYQNGGYFDHGGYSYNGGNSYSTDPCDYTWCYPQFDDSEYVSGGSPNNNLNSSTNTNINTNEIYINIYGNGSVTGSGIDLRDLPSCNDARDNDEDGRIDFDDSDCEIYGRENGKNTRLNVSTPRFVSTALTSAREGVTYVYDVDAWDNDGDTLTYSLLQNPVGMHIEHSTGVIRWTPTSAQSGMAHGVTVSVTDGSRQALQSFQIFAEKTTRSTGVSQNEGRVAGTSVVAVAEASDRSTLRAYNIRIDADELGNSVVTWDTTKPTRGRVLYGLASQGDRSGTDFTGTGQYEFATPNTPETSTSHRVVLGQLEPERVYYFRVVSFIGTDIIASSERSFVQLGEGGTFSGDTGFASAISSLGSFIFSTWFLLLMVIIIVLILVFRRRNQHEIIAHAPVEMHTGAGHH